MKPFKTFEEYAKDKTSTTLSEGAKVSLGVNKAEMKKQVEYSAKSLRDDNINGVLYGVDRYFRTVFGDFGPKLVTAIGHTDSKDKLWMQLSSIDGFSLLAKGISSQVLQKAIRDQLDVFFLGTGMKKKGSDTYYHQGISANVVESSGRDGFTISITVIRSDKFIGESQEASDSAGINEASNMASKSQDLMMQVIRGYIKTLGLDLSAIFISNKEIAIKNQDLFDHIEENLKYNLLEITNKDRVAWTMLDHMGIKPGTYFTVGYDGLCNVVVGLRGQEKGDTDIVGRLRFFEVTIEGPGR